MDILKRIFKIKSVTIKASLITAAAVIVAAIIGLYSYSDKSSDITTTSSNVVGSIVGKTGNIAISNYTINYIVPENATKEAIKQFEELEMRLNQTEGKVELTREEIRLLAQALKDLDQRTSGIQKLPDGRTKFGTIIAGEPSIVAQELGASEAYFNSKDYSNALMHSENAIKAYEDSKQYEATASMITGRLTQEGLSYMFNLATMSAQRLGKNELAYQYAKRAVEASGTPLNNAVLAETLYDLGKYKEALEYIDKALQDDPKNLEFISLKEMILKKG